MMESNSTSNSKENHLIINLCFSITPMHPREYLKIKESDFALGCLEVKT